LTIIHQADNHHQEAGGLASYDPQKINEKTLVVVFFMVVNIIKKIMKAYSCLVSNGNN